MDSRNKECLSEIRIKVMEAEDRLMIEQKDLYDFNQKLAEKREKWEEEVKEIELSVSEIKKEVQEKEIELEEVKQKLKEVYYKPRELEIEIEELDKETEKESKAKEKQQTLTDDIQLMHELDLIRQKRQDVMMSIKFLKSIEESEETNSEEREGDVKAKEQVRVWWEEIEKKMKVFDQTMRDINSTSLSTQKQRLQELRDCRDKLEKECAVMEQENKALDEKIKSLEGEASEPGT